jgi:hypothetical protein
MSQEELLNLTRSARLTLTETYDRGAGIPKDFKELYAFHKKELPQTPLLDPPAAADIAILVLNESKAEKHFLTMLQKSLEATFEKKVILTGRSGWETAKLTLGEASILANDPHLSKFFKETSEATLGDIPFIPLNDLAACLLEPKQKRSFWKALCLEIAGRKSPKSS